MNLETFKKLLVIGILRGINLEIVEQLMETIIASGLKTVELTMNTRGAEQVIRRMVSVSAGRLFVGAGTVLSMDSLHSALDSGAAFIVMPVMVADVVEYCLINKIPVFPGALTPQEIYNAWSAGATMVKVFPAKLFGPAYFKEVKAPLSDIKLLACGGVNPDTVNDYFACGASAVAFGASIFRKDLLLSKQFGVIKQEIQALISKIQDR
ncbi:bifunctional 4-hydroxy-2-oxoglutarate aldolase/2-dehydro-3-deoxy-phosphogluconate aldolase [Candidatus Omnitrophota bacterium]